MLWGEEQGKDLRCPQGGPLPWGRPWLFSLGLILGLLTLRSRASEGQEPPTNIAEGAHWALPGVKAPGPYIWIDSVSPTASSLQPALGRPHFRPGTAYVGGDRPSQLAVSKNLRNTGPSDCWREDGLVGEQSCRVLYFMGFRD